MTAVGPNIVDRAVSWFSPRAGLNRMRYRMAAGAVGGYLGARRDRNATSRWSVLSASADADTLPDLDTLRARSRDMVRNDPLAHSAVSTKVANVIGAGHVVRPELDAARLGLSEAQADAWEEQALDIWRDWAESRDCDITRTQTFAEMEDLVYRSMLLSGDVLAVRRFKERPGRLLGTALQVVEGDRLSNPEFKPDGPTLAGGVEMDRDGAPIRYHIANRHGADRCFGAPVKWQGVPARDRHGRVQVLHIHGIRWRPDMTRYAPLLAPVIESLKQRSRYSEAELMAAVVSACFAVGLKSGDGLLGDGLKDVGGQTQTAAGAEIRFTEPGQVFDLLPDEDVQAFAPGRPNPQFSPFVDAVAQEVGAGIDLPVELLMKSFKASYSASRAALEMAWLYFRADRARHVSQFCVPAYEAVITEAVARGRLRAPGFFGDPLRRRHWLAAVWMGPARPTIDPVKDATADRMYLDMGATSLTRIVAERFGTHADAVRRRRALDGSDAIVSAQVAKIEGDDDDAD